VTDERPWILPAQRDQELLIALGCPPELIDPEGVVDVKALRELGWTVERNFIRRPHE